MNGRFTNNLFRFNAVMLSCFPAAVMAESPWRVTDGSTLNVTSSYSTDIQDDYPLFASGNGSHLLVNPNLSFSSKRDNLDVLQVKDGALAELDSTTIIANNNNSNGVFLSGGQLTMSEGYLITLGENSSAIKAEQGSRVTLNNVEINTNTPALTNSLMIDNSQLEISNSLVRTAGSGTGLYITGDSNVTLDNVELSMTALDSTAALIVEQGTVNSNKLSVYASGNYGIQVKGQDEARAPLMAIQQGLIRVTNGVGMDVTQGHVTLDTAQVETIGTAGGSHGINVNHHAQVDIHHGQYVTKGTDSHAINLVDNTSVVNVNGALLAAYGENAYAFHIAQGTGSLTDSRIKTWGQNGHAIVSHYADVEATRSTVNTTGDGAIAALAQSGGAMHLEGSSLNTQGIGAYGLAVDSGSGISANDITVGTAGNAAHALYLAGGAFDLTNSAIAAEGQGASAVYVNGDSSTELSQVTLDNTVLSTADATGIVANGAGLDVTLQNGTQLNAGNGLLALSRGQNSRAESHGAIQLMADDHVMLNGDIRAEPGSTLDLSLRNQSSWHGAAFNATDVAVDHSSSWHISDNSDVANLYNAGQVVFTPKAQAQTRLTVRGNYVGQGGTLVFNTVLGNENSVTNKMQVEGDTSGSSYVVVNNLGGKGDYTEGDGIELIRVAGHSDGEFIQQGRIVAGAWDYTLTRGAGANAANWYLSNQRPEVPDEDQEPETPAPGGSGEIGQGEEELTEDATVKPSQPAVEPEARVPHRRRLALRPESGIYLANFTAANNLFVTRLHDRLGETQFTDNLSAKEHATSLWLRQEGGRNSSYNSDGQLKMTANRYVAQLGGDLVSWSQDQRDRWHLGLMAGYAHSHNQSRASAWGYRARGEVSGYSAGLYSTWYANEQDKTGSYVDSWALYNWFKNSVKGEDLPEENYHARGVIASLEAGYTEKLAEVQGSLGSVSQWFIQPKAQVVWQGVKANDHQEANGTRVQSGSNDNIMTSLGVRTFLQGSHRQDADSARQFEPFVELNWIHNSKTPEVRMDNALIQQAGARNLGEVKLGIEARLDNHFKGWTNVAQRMGDAGYADSQFMLGINYHF